MQGFIDCKILCLEKLEGGKKMAHGVNKVILIASLGRDPETKHMPNGDTVCNFSVAVSESWKGKDGDKQERTEWINIVAWRKLGEICGQYLRKGSKVYIEGKLQTRSWEKDGVKKYTTEVVAIEMQMLDGRRDENSVAANHAAPTGAGPATGSQQPNFDDADLPF